LKLFQVNECLLKTLLDSILCVCEVFGETHRAEQNQLSVALDEQLERFVIAALGGRHEQSLVLYPSAAGLDSRDFGVHMPTATVLPACFRRPTMGSRIGLGDSFILT
jgi:hypothetical protein